MTDEEIRKLFTYHSPNDQSVQHMQVIRKKSQELALLVNQLVPESADKTASIRKLREFVMTINAAIVLNQ